MFQIVEKELATLFHEKHFYLIENGYTIVQQINSTDQKLMRKVNFSVKCLSIKLDKIFQFTLINEWCYSWCNINVQNLPVLILMQQL